MEPLIWDDPHADPWLRDAIRRQARDRGRAMQYAAELAKRDGLTPAAAAAELATVMVFSGGCDGSGSRQADQAVPADGDQAA
jgi:hypothetical protein